MNDAKSFFESEVIIDAEEIPFEGICQKCLGSGYAIAERNGIFGVLFTSNHTDSEGKPIKSLLRCTCGVEVSY